MPQDLISQYKSTGRLGFEDKNLETSFLDFSSKRGKSTSVFGFLTLALLSFVFAYAEYYALAIKSMLPMQLFIGLGSLAFINMLVSLFKTPAPFIRIRLISNVILLFGVILYTVIEVKYRTYYPIEAVLLLLWISVFSHLNLRLTFFLNLILIAGFVGAMQLAEESISKVILITVYLFSTAAIGVILTYLWERMRRMLFMTTQVMDDISTRQEVWAYTLIDLDMALSGVDDFKNLLGRILEFLGTVITFESSIITSLEGQGPKPQPLTISGDLFENEDKTIWGEALISKLEQTRQAFNSDFHIEKKGMFGKIKKEFKNFRLDIPVFNDFNLVGIISLRRQDKAFDDLDMTASVSLVSQAMLIYNRSTHTHTIQAKSGQKLSDTQTDPKVSTEDDTDLEVTGETEDQKKFLHSSPNINVAPKSIRDSFKKQDEKSKKSLVILSREKADKISLDLYRMASIDGDPLSFIILEIDGLSSIREKDGDKVAYRVFSGIAKQLFSKIDKQKHIVGRYGKNGLSLLMPRVDMNAAEKFAETFRKFVEEEKYKTVYGTRSATLSVGIAAITDDTGDYSAMTKRADMALFVAKKNGRNCVKVRL